MGKLGIRGRPAHPHMIDPAVTHVVLRDSVGGNKPIEFSLQGPDLQELERLTELALAQLEDRGVRVRPSTKALALAVDKLHQRRTLAAMDGVLVPAFASVRAGKRQA